MPRSRYLRDPTRPPEIMTPQERYEEIASLLATSLHRLRNASIAISESSPQALEDREDDRLSVSPQTTKGGVHADG